MRGVGRKEKRVMAKGYRGLRERSKGQVLARDGFRGSGPLYIRSRDLQPKKDPRGKW